MRPLLLLLYLALATLSVSAQQNDPMVDYFGHQLHRQVLDHILKTGPNHVHMRTTSGTVIYTIPVVVHVLHNYGSELIGDQVVYKLIDDMNSLLLQTTPDTAFIIDKYKSVAANTGIALKLATKDPQGNPTKGIEHLNTYLTQPSVFNEDQIKINQWPQDKYLNIWICKQIYTGTGYGIISGRSTTPFQAAYYPYYDGIILNYQWLNRLTGLQPFARFLNLPYPCQNFSTRCADNDGIPDTPPCGEPVTCAHILDSTCDTPNRQNVMSAFDETCAIMFTHGQAEYMQYILQLDFGKRDSLVSAFNFIHTGMNQPMPDLKPIADFYIRPRTGNIRAEFFCIGQDIRFTNASWNDTITDVSWSFSNNPLTGTVTSAGTVTNRFQKPGWATVTLSATGNNSGTTTSVRPRAFFLADTAAIASTSYTENFTGRGITNSWPMFNYFGNNFKWDLSSSGYDDNACLQYTGLDTRIFPENMTGTPQGDYDDVFSPVFNLTDRPGLCYLNFATSGATRADTAKWIRDTLEISYSTDFANNWQRLKSLSGTEIANYGYFDFPYTPRNHANWKTNSILLPSVAQTAHTIFRFRYYPGADSTGKSTSNNFYLDKISFSDASINSLEETEADMISLAPNPTSGSVYITIPQTAGDVSVIITDITGRMVYKAMSSRAPVLEIPYHSFPTKGMYFVDITNETLSITKKLVVY